MRRVFTQSTLPLLTLDVTIGFLECVAALGFVQAYFRHASAGEGWLQLLLLLGAPVPFMLSSVLLTADFVVSLASSVRRKLSIGGMVLMVVLWPFHPLLRLFERLALVHQVVLVRQLYFFLTRFLSPVRRSQRTTQAQTLSAVKALIKDSQRSPWEGALHRVLPSGKARTGFVVGHAAASCWLFAFCALFSHEIANSTELLVGVACFACLDLTQRVRTFVEVRHELWACAAANSADLACDACHLMFLLATHSPTAHRVQGFCYLIAQWVFGVVLHDLTPDIVKHDVIPRPFGNFVRYLVSCDQKRRSENIKRIHLVRVGCQCIELFAILYYGGMASLLAFLALAFFALAISGQLHTQTIHLHLDRRKDAGMVEGIYRLVQQDVEEFHASTDLQAKKALRERTKFWDLSSVVYQYLRSIQLTLGDMPSMWADPSEHTDIRAGQYALSGDVFFCKSVLSARDVVRKDDADVSAVIVGAFHEHSLYIAHVPVSALQWDTFQRTSAPHSTSDLCTKIRGSMTLRRFDVSRVTQVTPTVSVVSAGPIRVLLVQGFALLEAKPTQLDLHHVVMSRISMKDAQMSARHVQPCEPDRGSCAIVDHAALLQALRQRLDILPARSATD
ncbi:MAG: hypothetical protein MHM6MM_006038 [Cercozoa sp. M6MM]